METGQFKTSGKLSRNFVDTTRAGSPEEPMEWDHLLWVLPLLRHGLALATMSNFVKVLPEARAQP